MLITDQKELARFSSHHRVWQGIPGIVRTRGGQLFVSFYSGDTKETYGNYAVVVRSDNGEAFSEPIVAAEKTGNFRCFDPVLWIDPLDRLWFIWNVSPGEAVYAAICDDPDAEQLVWSEEKYIGQGVMMNKPLVLTTGEWLFPIALWSEELHRELRKNDPSEELVAASYVYKTSDNGKTFLRLGGADVRNRSFDEHMVLEQENGVLRMLVRLKKGIGESYSYDRGNNWSRGQVTELGGPSSRFFFQKLRSGRVLLINHYQYQGRNNLTAMLSEDDGQTFPYTLLLDGRNQVSYPDAMEGEDGYIDIVYDRERGCFKHSLEEAYADAREILIARINEEDIMRGEVCSSQGYLARVVSKLGRLADEDGDPYAEPLLEDSELARMLIESGEGDPIGKIFEKYPLNCVDVGAVDTKALDGMIARFQGNGQDKALLTKIIRTVRTACRKDKNVYPAVVDALKAYLMDHLSEDLSVADLADHLRISIYYLSHVFKEQTGVGIIGYRNELRLTESKRILLHTDRSIGEIAQELGFCSAAYFTELFTKSEGVSPSEFRKLHRYKR